MVEVNDTSPARVSLLAWVSRLGAVTAEALAERDEVSIASARGRLLGATRTGLLVRSRPLAEGPSLYAATRAGLRAAGMRALDPVRLSAANARHAAVCAAVAVGLERAYPDHRVMGERELRADERARGAVLASATLPGGRGSPRLLHRPDLVLWPPEGRVTSPVAVEVELTVKAPRRLLEICRAWARCRCVAGVLYLAPREVRGPLGRAVDGADAAGKIVVLGLHVFAADGALAGSRIERTIPADS